MIIADTDIKATPNTNGNHSKQCMNKVVQHTLPLSRDFPDATQTRCRATNRLQFWIKINYDYNILSIGILYLLVQCSCVHTYCM